MVKVTDREEKLKLKKKLNNFRPNKFHKICILKLIFQVIKT